MFRVSCIQLRSNNSISQNLKKTEKLINKAIKQKTDFILTPEVSSLFSLNKKQLLKVCKSMNEDNYIKGIKIIAKKYKKWILIGSVIIKISKTKFRVLIGPFNDIKSIKESFEKMKSFNFENLEILKNV